jgi:sugar fermentation stimulation protein A
LLRGTLIRRYKRFLADVELDDGTVVTALCPNTGRMTSCSEPGRLVLLSDSGNPQRKHPLTWEMIRMGRTWVGVNTGRPNGAVAHFVRQGRIPELAGYREMRREVPYGEGRRSRIDLLLTGGEDGRRSCWVEVKNSTLRVRSPGDGRRGTAAFPDAVTERGRKHLLDLAGVVERGERGVIFFFVGRADCHAFRPADEIDPAYGETLRRVAASGVEILAYRIRFSTRRLELLERLPVDLAPVVGQFEL